MKIFLDKKKLAKITSFEKNLGFVPTMGNLHYGHISLIKKSISQCNRTIVTIFINKQQFNRKSDYTNYPRTINKDVSILKKLNVDYLYIPKHNQIYPHGYNKKIKIHSFSKKLCGKYRPGHFEAVVDVIDRFINIIKPNKIYLGKKDLQQLKIVQNFVSRKYKKIKVIGLQTVREKNGIPFSSRNNLLSKKQKAIASQIYKILLKNKINLITNKVKIKSIKKNIFELGVRKMDYLKLIDINKITKSFDNKKKYKIFIAYYLGSTRLIDNI